MNIEEAKAKLNSVSTGTALRHHKLLIADLCAVVKFLLDELERDNNPETLLHKKMLLENLDNKKKANARFPWQKPIDEPCQDIPQRRKSGDAGDAE